MSKPGRAWVARAGTAWVTHAGSAWVAFSGLLALASLAAFLLPPTQLDWQPTLVAQEPWRAFSAAFVHWSPLHLGANLMGTLVVAALGLAARLRWPLALAWAAAWPLTQLGLLWQPALAHYGGLSGVLHAGVAVAALALVVCETGPRRWLGLAVLAGLLIKLVLEDPFGPPLRHGGGWDIATAPLAHATGTAAGLLCAALALRWSRSAAASAA